jgi:hypothetical protein
LEFPVQSEHSIDAAGRRLAERDQDHNAIINLLERRRRIAEIVHASGLSDVL